MRILTTGCCPATRRLVTSRRDDIYPEDYGRKSKDTRREQVKDVDRFGWTKLLLPGVGGNIIGFSKKGNKAPNNFRFKKKERVECNVGGSWIKGKIVKLWHPIDEGLRVPYKVRLDDGKFIYATNDADHTIRAVKKKKKK